ncbi:FG-GAP-like repeat-containing protein [Candidatus Palauibacter sp.]|uniref:FG-GAP-like repeat-containing protein n=1 Tax=Candidatus Palauibacter sp. TaxID=3101350 RepID=UPI003AF2D7E2
MENAPDDEVPDLNPEDTLARRPEPVPAVAVQSLVPAGTMDIGDGEWSCAPGDVNGDGLMDVFIGTRRSDEVVTLASRGDGTFDSGHFVIFENVDGRFRRRPEELAARTAASCAILHDRDNDGDLDITGIDEIDDLLLLFENVPN